MQDNTGCSPVFGNTHNIARQWQRMGDSCLTLLPRLSLPLSFSLSVHAATNRRIDELARFTFVESSDSRRSGHRREFAPSFFGRSMKTTKTKDEVFAAVRWIDASDYARSRHTASNDTRVGYFSLKRTPRTNLQASVSSLNNASY